jgi:hypothetical protein
MGDAVGNDLNGEPLSVADRFVPALPVTHYARKIESLRDPAAVLLAIKINRQIHPFSYAKRVARPLRPSQEESSHCFPKWVTFPSAPMRSPGTAPAGQLPTYF